MVRMRTFAITTLLGFLIVKCYAQQNNARSYDTNDWIPVSRPRYQNEDSSVENGGAQKRPTGRVLNLPSSDQKRFFPTESSATSQPYRIPLNTNPDSNKQQKSELFQLQPPKYQPELTTYVPSSKQQQQQQHQQILLPPQLQSIISQNQPLLSPQRINSQLLQQPYLNTSEFNSKDVVQNINLGLYQQSHQQVQPSHESEEVQLLYVPLENLQQRGHHQQLQFSQERVSPTQYTPPYQQHKQIQLQNIQQDFAQQALQAQKLQDQFSHNIQPVAHQQYRRPYHDSVAKTTTSATVTKKRKPHQPPLAVYMGTEGQATKIEIDDVLSLLKDAKSISVQDNVGPASPQVFVGPSHLEAPDGYVKFDLPYLSSIESNRVERKVDQLPFFVAPLSYKAPPGYSKIPFPAPHVGSVVINNLKTQQQQQQQPQRQRQQYQQEVTSRPQIYEEENYSEEISTVKTRGRQRQPSRNTYTASTIQTPVSAEIPYGPLPTKNQHHSVQESLVSPNPYGPTQFVQPTTPAVFDKPASIPDQIFSTKNRFSTPSPYVQNSAVRQNQYQQHHLSTEPTPESSTLSGTISNDKYTVLEEFSIAKKPQNQYKETQPERIPLKNHQRRPTENYFSQEADQKSALPLVSNLRATNNQYLEPESHPTFTQKHEQKEFIPTQIPTQLVSEYETQQPTILNTPSQLFEQRPQEQQVFTQTQQSIAAYEVPQRHQQHHTQTQQSQIQKTNDKYEIPHRHNTPTQQTRTQAQQINEAYETPQRQVHHTQTQRTTTHQTNDAYDVPQRQAQQIQFQQANDAYNVPQQLVQHHTQTQQTIDAYESPQRYQQPQLEQHLNLAPLQQSSNEYEALPRQQIHETSTRSQTQQSSSEYEIPQRRPQRPQQEEQSSNEYEAPKRQRPQETSTRSQTRTRGKQHFTPDDYSKEDYDYSAINDKTTEHNKINHPYSTHETPRPEVKQFDADYYRPHQVESQITVTREPVVEYHLPIQSTASPQFIPGTYYSDENIQGQTSHEYTLPKKLPPISPQLPGLVNSLEDQAFHPLLAPLLLPTSEEVPVEEITSEFYPTPPSTTPSTTTQYPIIETTTKRNRGRQRGTRPTTNYDYSNTTPNPTSRRPQSSYRGRRPYNRPRSEYTKQVGDDSVRISTTAIPDITEGTTRSVYNRNRPTSQRERHTTTEQPRKAPTNSRQRFRTRGRPLKEDEYSERSTTEHASTFQLPELEGGFQASVPVIQPIVQSEGDDHVLIHQPRQDQSLVYVQNKPTLQDVSSISTAQYLPNRFGSSTESLEAIHHSTVGVSGPENNVVSDVIHNEPTVLINSNPISGRVQYDSREQIDNKPNIRTDSREQSYPNSNIYDSREQIDSKSNVRFDSREQGDTKSNLRFDSREQSDIKPNIYQSHVETNIPNSRYEVPKVKIQPTTEVSRSRTRIRTRPRIRTLTTQRYQPSTTYRTTTESQEESKEFYGFFRAPNFAKPVQMEYKEASELRTPARPTIAYVRPDAQNVYSTPQSYVPQIEDNYAENNHQSQYVSSTLSPTSEEIIDIKPVTRRPTSNFARARRPTGPAKVEISSETPVQSDRYFARGSKRPETEPQKVIRTRGRTRKPTRLTTSSPDSSETYQYSHSPRTNELANSNSAEIITPIKTRPRLSNRGKSHFQSPSGEKLEPESNNYPPSFLQAQQSQQHDTNYPTGSSTQRSIQVVKSQDINTPRPSFQLTIEPDEIPAEYLDQVPNSSVNQPKITSVELEDGEESKFSAKVIEKPSNFNYIITDEKSSAKVEVTKKLTENEREVTPIPIEIEEKTEEQKEVSKQVTTPVIEAELNQTSEPTTELPVTSMDSSTEQQKRKGFWRLVNFRPIEDEFESAESQRVGTVFSNEFTAEEKHTRKYHSVKRIRTTTEPPLEETTTILPETTANYQPEETSKQVDNAERDMFANLYEMFGFSPETSDSNHNDESISEPEPITTEIPTEKSTFEVETTTFSSLNSTESSSPEKLESSESSEDSRERDEAAWHTRIIGTSTTTEISHETEICYRGRCIKSMTSEESSEKL